MIIIMGGRVEISAKKNDNLTEIPTEMLDFEGPKIDFEALSLKKGHFSLRGSVFLPSMFFTGKDGDLILESHRLLHSKT